MPDIPNVPGVPALSSYGIEPFSLLASDVLLPIIVNALAGPQWGIYLSAASFASPIESLLGSLGLGAFGGIVGSVLSSGVLFGIPVILADSTVSFELKQDFSISDYPVESGGFQSYDKVQLPTDIRLRLSAGGSEANRQAFLASIDAQIKTTLLYDIVTPETVYLNYCFSHRDFRRNAQNGAGLIVVDLWMTEIRVTASATFSSVAIPQIAGPQGLGVVQPQAVTGNFGAGLGVT